MSYGWTGSAAPNLPASLPAIHKDQSGGLDGLIDSAVEGIIDHTPLKQILAQVTGNADALHEAGQQWLDQAHAASQLAEQLKSGARPLDGNWGGPASDKFGSFMADVVTQVDSMAEDMAQTAQILNNAGQECQLAQDMVVTIIRELIEWSTMTLAATAVADFVTFGLATIVGGIAEGAEVAAFVARATQVSEKLGKTLEELLKMLKEIEEAGKGIKSAEGLSKLKAAWKARKEIHQVIDDYKVGMTGFRVAAKDGKALKAAEEAGDADRIARIADAQGMSKQARQALGLVYGKVGSKAAALAGLPATGNLWPALGKDLWSGASGSFKEDGGVGLTTNGLSTPTPAPYHLPERPPAQIGAPETAGGNGVMQAYLDSLGS